MQTTTTTMNTGLNQKSGALNTPISGVETVQPLAAGKEKTSVMGRIAAVSSNIFSKIRNVLGARKDTVVPLAGTVVPEGAIPSYKTVTPGDLVPIRIPSVEQIPAARVKSEKTASLAGKDLFAHLSDRTAPMDSIAPAEVDNITARLSALPTNKQTRARVLPRVSPTVDYKFEYTEPVAAPVSTPDLSALYSNRTLEDAVKPSAVPTPAIAPKTTPKRAVSALEDVNNYVAGLDSQYYAEREARRSRGILKNLSLWATRIKEDFVSAVAPNYVMKKAYEAAQAPESAPAAQAPAVTPVAQPAPAAQSQPAKAIPAQAAAFSAPVQAKPSLFARLKAGYENLKSTLFPKARKLATAAALAGAAVGMNASDRGLAQPVGAQKTAVTYTAKAAVKTEARTAASTKSISPVKSVPVVSPSANRPAVNVKPAPPASPAPWTTPAHLSNELAALNAPSFSATLSDSPSAGIGKATERVLTPDPFASITDSINDAYVPKTGFQNGIYRGYHSHNDGSATVSRTSLCSR